MIFPRLCSTIRLAIGCLAAAVALSACGQAGEVSSTPSPPDEPAVTAAPLPSATPTPKAEPGLSRTPPPAEPSAVAPAPTPLPTLAGFEQLPDAPIGFPEPVERSLPVGLSISGLGIDAIIRPTGVDAVGDFDVPPAGEVGWYEFGPTAGEAGSTVLAAHIAYNGVDGVFRNLDRLEIGATIQVTNDDGTTATYRTVSLDTWPKEELPADLFGRSGEERLVLITCGGSFNPSLRSYADNVVAIAVPL